MNEQNLIPNSERTPSELKEQTRRAGIASGKARREKAQRIKDLLAAFDVEPIDPKLARDADSVLLAMTNRELKRIADDENAPTYMRRRARLLLQKDDEKAFDVSEKMLDRAFGKPKQALDMGIEQKPPITILPDEVIVEQDG